MIRSRRDKTKAIHNRIIDYIQSYTDLNGYPPALRDIQSELLFHSVASVYYHLNVLRRIGRVTWQATKARTLKVIDHD